ncbi:hypothetical protein SNE40_007398 [Patella caerulea]|uniref:Uncharacterized protein n=1 Tax=Patella caerulea TaxID=87958 RepID=A0AAN8JXU5_PATCE
MTLEVNKSESGKVQLARRHLLQTLQQKQSTKNPKIADFKLTVKFPKHNVSPPEHSHRTPQESETNNAMMRVARYWDTASGTYEPNRLNENCLSSSSLKILDENMLSSSLKTKQWINDLPCEKNVYSNNERKPSSILTPRTISSKPWKC